MNAGREQLHVTRVGTGPITAVFLHGLLGQAKNLAGAAKALDGVASSLLIDVPNHGSSAWTQDFDYRAIADLIAAELTAQGATDKPVVLIGHSMGGKIAMTLTLDHPELVAKLIVMDIAPVQYPHSHEANKLISAMQALDLTTLQSRSQASAALSLAIPNSVTRNFVLQNLHRIPGQTLPTSWQWKANLALLASQMPHIEGFPHFAGRHWDGPVLWITGGNSDYVRPEYFATMQALFPHTQYVCLEEAGHWVHADQPAQVARLIRQFITGTNQ